MIYRKKTRLSHAAVIPLLLASVLSLSLQVHADTLYTYTSGSGNWTVPSWVIKVDVLVVGGGEKGVGACGTLVCQFFSTPKTDVR